MASKEEIENLLLADYKSGKFSQRDLVKKYGFSKGKISRLCKDKKAENGALIEEAVNTTIKQNEIMGKIGALSGADKQKVIMEIQEATNKANVLNMFDHSTIKNQSLINRAQDTIYKQIEANEDAAIDHLPNLMAISKTTESNRKQVLGATETYSNNNDTDNGQGVKSGLGELYKVIGD